MRLYVLLFLAILANGGIHGSEMEKVVPGKVFHFDFNKVPLNWGLNNCKFKSASDGINYLRLQTNDSAKDAQFSSPRIELLDNINFLDISFCYQSSVTDSTAHAGTWVYFGFFDENNKPNGYHGLPLAKSSDWRQIKDSLSIPLKTKSLLIQFRIQGKANASLNMDDINIKFGKNESHEVGDYFLVENHGTKDELLKNGCFGEQCLLTTPARSKSHSRVTYVIQETEKADCKLLIFPVKIREGANVKFLWTNSNGDKSESQKIEFLPWMDERESDWMTIRIPVKEKLLTKVWAEINTPKTKDAVWLAPLQVKPLTTTKYAELTQKPASWRVVKNWEVVNPEKVSPITLKGVKKGNKIRNSSFELGGDGYDMPVAINSRVKSGNSPHGNKHLSFHPTITNPKTGKFLSGIYPAIYWKTLGYWKSYDYYLSSILNSEYYRITPGKLYTLSAYVRSAKPNTRVRMIVHSGHHLGREIFDLRDSRAGASTTVSAGPEWSRKSFSFIPDYRVNSSCKLYFEGTNDFEVDAIQLEEGGLTDYQSDQIISGALREVRGDNFGLYLPGEKAEFEFTTFSNDKEERKIDVDYELRDYWGKVIEKRSKRISLKGSLSVTEAFSPKEPGIYALKANFADPLSKINGSTKTMTFGVLPSDLSKIENNYFGAHFTFNLLSDKKEKRLELLKKLGIKWLRVYGTMSKFTTTWSRFVESEPGKFNLSYGDKILGTLASEGFNLLAVLTPGSYNKWLKKSYDKTTNLPDMKLWRRYVRKVVGRHKDKVKCWEVWNEPYYALSPKSYAKALKNASEVIREEAPQAKIAGFCCHVRNNFMNWLEGVFQNTSPAEMDVLSRHGYASTYPELDSEPQAWRLQVLKGFMNKYWRKEIPIWDTESAVRGGTFLLDRFPGYDTHMQRSCGTRKGDYKFAAEQLARENIIAMANGQSRRFYYIMHVNPFQNRAYNPYCAMFEYTGAPQPVLMVMAEQINLLSGTKFFETVKIADGVQCHIFEKDGGVVCALWRVNGRDDDSEDTLKLSTTPNSLKLINFMGGKYLKSKFENGKLEIAFNGEPLYLTSKTLAPKQLSEIIKQGSLERPECVKAKAFNVKLGPEKGKLFVNLLNEGAGGQKGKIKISSKPDNWRIAESIKFQNLKNGACETVQSPIESMKGEAELTLEITSDSGRKLCTAIAPPRPACASKAINSGKIVIDGNIEDWDKSNPIFINDEGQVKMGAKNWNGAEDLSATVYSHYDNQNLYISISVSDQKIFPDNRIEKNSGLRSLKQLYEGDSAEIFFDTSFAGTKNSKPLQLLCAPASADKKLKSAFYLRKTLNSKGIAMESSTNENGYLLEVKVPITTLGVEKLENGTVFGFDITINDKDKAEGQRESTMIWNGSTENYAKTDDYAALILKDGDSSKNSANKPKPPMEKDSANLNKLEILDETLETLHKAKDEELKKLVKEYQETKTPSEKNALAAFILGEREFKAKHFMAAPQAFAVSVEAYQKLAAQKKNSIFEHNCRIAMEMQANANLALSKVFFATPAMDCHGRTQALKAKKLFQDLEKKADDKSRGKIQIQLLKINKLLKK